MFASKRISSWRASGRRQGFGGKPIDLRAAVDAVTKMGARGEVLEWRLVELGIWHGPSKISVEKEILLFGPEDSAFRS